LAGGGAVVSMRELVEAAVAMVARSSTRREREGGRGELKAMEGVMALLRLS
jgi:hypothetical protein